MTTPTTARPPQRAGGSPPLPPPATAPYACCACPTRGAPVMYRAWDKALAGTAEVLPLCLPGKAHRWGEPLEHDLHRIADAVVEATAPLQRDLPLALFGYSLGALLAFEVARGLARRGRPLLLLIVAACAPAREFGALSPNTHCRRGVHRSAAGDGGDFPGHPRQRGDAFLAARDVALRLRAG
ncbi:thioesterase II family protein [Streptomyces sp. NPDC059743]|uniref:thioesterase II family protein n=1 Tax=Streptomyces sp. NPDC059743 TaxID=3346928 RepID=UPI003652A713